VASRAEEKERRRREREAQELAAQRAASRRRALQVGAGAVAGIAVIGVVALLALGGGDGGDGTASASEIAADARAAGCTFRQFPSEGREHTTGKVTYRTNPPTSGNHNPLPAPDGIYKPGNEPNKENWVHSLEHGRILFQYAKRTPQGDVNRMIALAQEKLKGSDGYHTLVFQNNTNMPARFAAVAWTRSLTCNRLGDPQLSAMRKFREAYTDKAPEFVP
jgi:Protein of unknown function (DUF3105)